MKLPNPVLQVASLIIWLLGAGDLGAQTIGTAAGSGVFGYNGDGGPATSASLADPAAVFPGPDGRVYIADTSNRRIRLVDTDGSISTVAGTGDSGYSGDGGPATDAALADPAGVFVDSQGRIYIADTNNHRIRRVDADGTILTVAGDGNAGYAGDSGPATDARLNFPTGLFVDGAGSIYFADRENHRVRRVDASGTITTVAGNGGFGYSGDGGPATMASLAFPSDVVADAAGNLFVADRFNFRIRKVNAAGVITTVAGNGSFGYSGDGGPATSAGLSFPSSVALDGPGNLYIADRDNNRVRKVDDAGTITTIAGDGTPGYGGDDGPAVNASLNRPSSVRVDGQGNIYVADTSNRRVRRVTAPIRESTAATGLQGVVSVLPGEVLPVLSIGVTGDGTTSVTGIRLSLLDLDQATGLSQSDFQELRVYRSLDAMLDAGDSQIEVYAQGSIQIGVENDVPIAGPSVPPGDLEWFYIVALEINATVTDGHAFKVAFPAGGVSTSAGTVGTAVAAGEQNHGVIQVSATRLVFSTQPDGAVSGQALSVQPVVSAVDDFGNVDVDFVDTVTLTSGGPGVLSNGTAVAANGVATFDAFIYQATADQESFLVTADDTPDGTEGDLPSVQSAETVCDVVATQLAFSVQPAGGVSGLPLSTQPTVSAVDAAGTLDTGFQDIVTLGHTGSGQLAGNTASAAGGVAVFNSVVYTAAQDGEQYALTADDAAGGPEGDLPIATSVSTTSDVVATQLVFSTQPSGWSAGAPLATQPVVVAQDPSGAIDSDFAETVTLSASGSGTLTGGSAEAASGVAVFQSVTYAAAADHASITLTADDLPGGTEGDLPATTSDAFVTDIVATRLVFTVQPSDARSGQAFAVPPTVAGVNADGVVDVDFSDTITLTVSGPGTITNGSKQATAGSADFSALTYRAVSDGEMFTLTADDSPAGPEGNLPAITSIQVRGDIAATRLEFLVQPGGSVSGKPMSTQPVVVARDPNGVVDVDFEDAVTLTAVGQGQVVGATAVAVAGVVSFTQVTHLATVDGSLFALSADDTEAGSEGNLSAVNSDLLTTNVVATRLVFVIQPDGSVSGSVLDATPVVAAWDEEGVLDTDFAEALSIRSGGPGSVTGASAQAQGGWPPFPALSTWRRQITRLSRCW